MRKSKVKIELVYWRNKKDSFDGYVSLNEQHFKFWNLPFDLVLNKLQDDVKFLCKELEKNDKK